MSASRARRHLRRCRGFSNQRSLCSCGAGHGTRARAGNRVAVPPHVALLRGTARRGVRRLLEQRTGLTIDPLFSASKIRWLLDSLPDGHRRAANGELCAGTSTAGWSGTHGRSRARLRPDERLTHPAVQPADARVGPGRARAVRRAAGDAPDVRPSSGILGTTVARGRLQAGVPVASAIGDSHAALFGHAAFSPAASRRPTALGRRLMTSIPEPYASRHGLSTTWRGRRRAVRPTPRGQHHGDGGAVEWLGRLLGLPDPASGVANLACTVADPDGVYMVPALAGLGAP